MDVLPDWDNRTLPTRCARATQRRKASCRDLNAGMPPRIGHFERAVSGAHCAVAGLSAPGDSCEDCLRTGDSGVHLRMCMSCGHVGCCDDSPNRQVTAHFRGTAHSANQSFEPGEDWCDWWYCYADDVAFLLDEAPSFSQR